MVPTVLPQVTFPQVTHQFKLLLVLPFNTTANNNVLVFEAAVFNSASVIEAALEGGDNDSHDLLNANKALKLVALTTMEPITSFIETDAAAKSTAGGVSVTDIAKLDNVDDVTT